MVWITSDHLVLSTCRNDLLLSGGGEGVGPDDQLLLEAAVAEDLYTVLALREDTLLQQIANIDGGAVLKFIQSGDIDDLQGLGKDVVEAALGDTADQRHLAALKAHADAAAGAGLLALVTLAGGLAVAGAGAAALTVGALHGAGRGGEFMQIHFAHLLTVPR